MALSYEFLIERAEEAAQDAANACLDNVRQRALRSEAAWRTMATQIVQLARKRENIRQKKVVAVECSIAPQ